MLADLHHPAGQVGRKLKHGVAGAGRGGAGSWPGRKCVSFPPEAGVRRRVVSSRNRNLELPNISDVCLEAATKEAARVIIITAKDKGKQTFTAAGKLLLLHSPLLDQLQGSHASEGPSHR